MRRLLRTLLPVLALCFAPATFATAMPELTMFQGETRVLAEPNAGRLAVGNGKVLSAAVLDDREILLIANDVGVSSLHIWTAKAGNRRVKVNVVPAETPRVNREIAAFLANIPNARSAVIGDKVVVEGDSLSNRDQARIEELAKRYPQIINFTNPVGWEKMIVMDVQIVEFPINMLREVGLAWNATGGAAVGGIWMPGRRGNAPLQIDLRAGSENAPPIINPDGSGGPVPLSSSLNVGQKVLGNIGRVVDGVDACRLAVREEILKGATQIKVMASGGVASPNDPIHYLGYSEGEIRARKDGDSMKFKKEDIAALAESLGGRGYQVQALHGGMTQDQRERVMKRTRAGSSSRVAPMASAKAGPARRSRLPVMKKTAVSESARARMAAAMRALKGVARSSSPAQYSNRSPRMKRLAAERAGPLRKARKASALAGSTSLR